MPITPFMGVRSSWLIVARNSDLARCAFCHLPCLDELVQGLVDPHGEGAELVRGAGIDAVHEVAAGDSSGTIQQSLHGANDAACHQHHEGHGDQD